MKPIIIIPAYNPPSSFMMLLDNVRILVSSPIMVVDDGSNPIIALNDDHIILMRNKNNRGKIVNELIKMSDKDKIIINPKSNLSPKEISSQKRYEKKESNIYRTKFISYLQWTMNLP